MRDTKTCKAEKKSRPTAVKPDSQKVQQALKQLFGECSLYISIVAPDADTSTDPGQRVVILRTLLRITQANLAKIARVRQADISIAENNFSNVKLKSLERIANALGTTVSDLCAH